MKCRSCAAEIAEKAIICYRCGAPTALPPRTPAAAHRSGRPVWLIVALILLVIAAGAWLVPMTPPDSPLRWGAWAALVVVTAAVVWFFRRSRVRIH